jgi:hypothetical protein
MSVQYNTGGNAMDENRMSQEDKPPPPHTAWPSFYAERSPGDLPNALQECLARINCALAHSILVMLDDRDEDGAAEARTWKLQFETLLLTRTAEGIQEVLAYLGEEIPDFEARFVEEHLQTWGQESRDFLVAVFAYAWRMS